jgi:hypothetical protein
VEENYRWTLASALKKREGGPTGGLDAAGGKHDDNFRFQLLKIIPNQENTPNSQKDSKINRTGFDFDSSLGQWEGWMPNPCRASGKNKSNRLKVGLCRA